MLRRCPRDQSVLYSAPLGEATVDLCGRCQGALFATGAMFAAAGVAADPSTWDRPETGGVTKPSTLRCPACERETMQKQDVAYEGRSVEIDRCAGCGGIWLDQGELDALVAIGHALRPVLEAEREKARASLDKLEAPDLRPLPSWWKPALAVAALVALVGAGVWYYVETHPPHRQYEQLPTRAKGEEGCPCGCDHSLTMAEGLRAAPGDTAERTIERSLTTIADREAVGYITERMVQHRLRLTALADELGIAAGDTRERTADRERDAAARCASSHATDASLRACSELAVHGERIEIVNGAEKLIGSSFRLWLELEDRSGVDRVLALPVLRAGAVQLPIRRWYVEGTPGERWDGRLPAHGRARVNVIGDIPDHLQPGVSVHASIAIGSLVLEETTEARRVIHLAVR